MAKTKKIPVGIVGLGMVGTPIKRWFEEIKGYKRGADLFCLDIDKKKGFNDDINKADIIFISVPTPTPKNKPCDTSLVQSVVKGINDGKIVVIKSTVPPGTIEALQKEFPKKKFIFNPEFLTESQVWADFIRPDRQILGFTKKSFTETSEVMSLLPLAPFMRPWSSDYSKKKTNATEAEMAKYASNIFGYIKVIYGNILADVCAGLSQKFSNERIAVDVDYESVRDILSADPRIGPAWLNVNYGNYSGAGGFCFPKDMNAFIVFIDRELIPELEKRSTAKGLIQSLKKAGAVLKAIRNYNRYLLEWQGLSEESLMKHNKEINLAKKKKIRVLKRRSKRS